uniref:DNA mismatch repair proteins mutS family domain-containing protein n=1 Tax=viral metagenome TaxID=1070528 RepID=A0A6C0EJD5_9ZZZZ
MVLIDEYLGLQEKYEKKYGPKTIVLYECGQFFEIYGVENETEKLGKIYEIADITNLSVSKRNNKYNPVCKKNPLMAGFPNHAFEKWKNILLSHNYTVIKIEQDGHGTKDPVRKVTEIVSPGINMESNNYTNNLISIYLEEINTTLENILYAGISIIDITTGENHIYEIKSDKNDNNYVLDEIFRCIQSYNPSEIIINTENLKMKRETIIKYLEIEGRIVHYDNYLDSHYLLENKYKIPFLEKIFPKQTMIGIIDYLDLGTIYWGLSSYIYLLQFSYEHNESILNKLIKPRIWDTTDYLMLSYDSINQLNIIPNKNLQLNTKYDSLLNLLDMTSTSLGKRLLKHSLVNPTINIDELEKRYNLIDCLRQKVNVDYLYLDIENMLEKVFDIEKLHRRMTIGLLNPASFSNLDISYRFITKLFNLIKDVENPHLNKILPDSKHIDNFNLFIKDYNSKLNLDIINGCTLNNIKKSIFTKGSYDPIDALQNKIDNCYLFFNTLGDHLSSILDIKTGSIELKDSDRDGFHYNLTKKRGQALKTKLANTVIKITVNNKVIVVDPTTIEYKTSSSITKLFSPEIKNCSEQLNFYQLKMMKLCTEQFKLLLNEYDEKYGDSLKYIVKFIAYLDYIKSCAKVSILYGYSKPIIDDKYGKSYIDSKNLRHPIIEKIHTDVEYVPNDVDLGNNTSGVLLYGVNAVGKSSYMKSVGLSIVMAQAGMYVPAESFRYYPYKYIFTRISGNDNIFKGQSTFAVEMSELRSIIKRADSRSLILGDELCSGTETVSGLSIVAAGVITLEKLKSSFIFATHLHQLSSMEEITVLDKIKNFHMETIYNEAEKKIIYNRRLKEGSGNAIYGLEVARAMNLDPSFISLANSIRKKILNIDEKIIPKKTSAYNSQIIIDTCKICLKECEEIHHIKPQCIADDNNIIEGHSKNIKHNLIQLCHDCHQKVENGDLEISGYVQTSSGIEVRTKNLTKNEVVDKKKSKKKYNSEQIDIIRDYAIKSNNNLSKSKKLLELEKNLKVSVSIIKKIWSDEY